jgi:hypothetical protein
LCSDQNKSKPICISALQAGLAAPAVTYFDRSSESRLLHQLARESLLVRKESRWATGLMVLGMTAFSLHVNTNDLALPRQDRLMQTKPSPNTPRARMPAQRHLPEMFRLEAVVDFPAEVVHAVGGTKAAFNAAL